MTNNPAIAHKRWMARCLAEAISRVEVTGKQCKLGDGEGMQVPVNAVYSTLERKKSLN